MSHATHSNAALTPRARLRLARLIVDHRWSPARAAERYDVSWRTAKKWADRYEAEADVLRAALGADLVAVEHMGSTAVPGLSAKPVIDISVGLRRAELSPD